MANKRNNTSFPLLFLAGIMVGALAMFLYLLSTTSMSNSDNPDPPHRRMVDLADPVGSSTAQQVYDSEIPPPVQSLL